MLFSDDTLTPTPAPLKALDGAVDLHCHSGPSPFPRRLNIRQMICRNTAFLLGLEETI